MGENAGQENLVGDTQGQGNGDSQGTGINPAWNDALSSIPQEFHSHLTPHFQKWDQNYQNSIQKVHSEYEPYKPFIEAQVTPEELNFGYGLYNALQSNPQEVLAALQEAIAQENGEYDPEQGQVESIPQQFDPQQMDIQEHPYVQHLTEQLNVISQILLGQREQEQQSQYDQEFDQELSSLKETYGEYDEKYVIGLLMANPEMETEDAVKQYKALEQQILSGKRQPGPPVLGSGGGFPNTTPDTRKLNSKDTRSVVQQMLQQAAQQNT